MKLIVMTSPRFFVEEDKILSALFDAGLGLLHLYKPGCEPVYSERLLTLLPESCRGKVVVHEHFYLKEEFRLRGICLDGTRTPVPVGYRGDVSRMCHSLELLRECKRNSDYVLLKSIFDSQSTPEDRQTFTLPQLEQAGAQGLIDRHVYALGGINIDNVRLMRDLGFGGIVICGDLWNRFDIHSGSDYRELINHFEKLIKETT